MSYFKSIKLLLGKEFLKIFPLTLVFVFASMLDLLGISLIGAYIAIVFDPTFILKLNGYSALDFLQTYNHSEIVLFFGSILIGIFFIKFFFSMLTNYFILYFSAFEQAKVQKLLINGMLNQSYENFLASNTGESLASIANLSGVYREVLQSILQILSNAIIIFAIFVFLGITSLATLTILVSMMAIIFGLYNFIFSKRIHAYGKDFSYGTSAMIQGTTEISTGLKEIKTLGKEKFFISWVSESADIIARSALGLNFLGLIPRNIIEVLLIVFVVMIVALNISDTAVLAATLSMLGIFIAGLIRVTPLITQLQTSWNMILYGEDPINALTAVITSQLTGIQKSQPTDIAPDSLHSEAFNLLQLKNISYSYPGSTLKAIDNISLTVEKGDFIGLVGPSGSGKTSLINIILGFLKVSSGTIDFNKRDIQADLFLWRQKCAYLPQDIFLINGSLKDNITFEKNSSNKVMLKKALELSKLSSFAESLPEGVDTDLGDKGVRLSGGQKQRVAIARAIFHQREILLLDESTSALDAETEKAVMEELITISKEKTIIAIAHRVSTLKRCNKIYKLDGGKLSGPYDYKELL